ncbi:MAG: mechanosensitive ion channel family protein [Tannerellaceae bacterium]|nr:mechanosensitive ion channel family protein [Tannerellaceae bacterium]
MNIDKDLSDLLVKLGLSSKLADSLDIVIIVIGIILVAFFINYLGKTVFLTMAKRVTSHTTYRFDDLLVQRNVIRYLINMLAPIIIYIALPFLFEEGRHLSALIRKICVIYIIFCFIMALNGLVLVLFDNYSKRKGNNHRPMRGFVQVVQVALFFIGFIVIISVLINRSPTTLFAGLGASAAILSLVFKDVITGFIAGVQLSMNDMVRTGDWITLNDNQTDGIVQEITLITVKIKNFDNSISTVPPTLLVTNTFKNWREMLESNGRLAKKSIFVDKASVKFLTPELLTPLQTKYPDIATLATHAGDQPTNTDLFRSYMEQYISKREDINPDMGLKIGELDSTDRGLPIQLFFFTKNKDDKTFERVQSEVFDHGMAVLPDFGLVIK